MLFECHSGESNPGPVQQSIAASKGDSSGYEVADTVKQQPTALLDARYQMDK